MKGIVLLVLLSLYAVQGFSQDGANTIIGVYGGGGLATSNNYDVALSGGIDYNKGVLYRTGLGFTLFYQGYNLLYDNESNSNKGGVGEAGVTIRNKSNYIFLAPKFTHSFGKKQCLKFYLNLGVGYNMSGTESMRKWDYRYGTSPGSFDSTINTTPNINKLLFRVGLGFTEYLNLQGKWFFTITEDFGFIANNLSTTADVNNPSRTIYSPHSLSPGYISILIGVSHSRY